MVIFWDCQNQNMSNQAKWRTQSPNQPWRQWSYLLLGIYFCCVMLSSPAHSKILLVQNPAPHYCIFCFKYTEKLCCTRSGHGVTQLVCMLKYTMHHKYSHTCLRSAVAEADGEFSSNLASSSVAMDRTLLWPSVTFSSDPEVAAEVIFSLVSSGTSS